MIDAIIIENNNMWNKFTCNICITFKVFPNTILQFIKTMTVYPKISNLPHINLLFPSLHDAVRFILWDTSIIFYLHDFLLGGAFRCDPLISWYRPRLIFRRCFLVLYFGWDRLSQSLLRWFFRLVYIFEFFWENLINQISPVLHLKLIL